MNNDPEKSVTPSPAGPAPGPRKPGARRKPRRWLPYAGAVLLVGLIIAGLWPKPAPVEIAQVAVGPLRVTVNEEGKTRVRHRYIVSAPVPGQLRRPPFKAGAPVVQGQTVVAVIDPLSPAMLDERTRAAAEARRDTAKAQLARASAELEFAASELRRFEKLFAEKTVSPQEFEAAQLRKTTADRMVTSAESELRQAEAQLEEFSASSGSAAQPRELLAPVTGKVLRVFEESARSVTPGMPLLEVGDPSDLEVVIEVLSRDGAIIQPGDPVEMDQWGGGVPLKAKVRLVEPAAFTKISALGVEEQRVNVIADLVTPPGQRGNLGDSFRVEAHIIIWEDANALKVPAGAVFRDGTGWAAYVIEGEHARLRKVEPGRSSGAEFQVLQGLHEGEQVIIYPGSRVKEGAKVRPVKI